jgi:hypothetical protein
MPGNKSDTIEAHERIKAGRGHPDISVGRLRDRGKYAYDAVLRSPGRMTVLRDAPGSVERLRANLRCKYKKTH